MNINAYTIDKNEESNVDRFMKGVSDVDIIVLIDTGSCEES